MEEKNNNFQTAMLQGYNAQFSRVAPPVVAITNYRSVQDLANGETLTHTPDILIAAAWTVLFHGGNIATFRLITAAEGLFLRDGGYSEAERGVLGGVEADAGSVIQQFVSKTRGYATELIMCYQVKPLKRANILNYFKSANIVVQSTDFITKWLQVASTRSARLVSIDELRTEALNNKFVKYHVAYASSGALVAKMASELGVLARFFITTAEINAAIASRDSPWDIAISEGVSIHSRVVTYGYLEAFDQLPENWYQGTAAWEAASTMLKRDILMVFKKYKRVSMNNPGLSNAETVGQLFRNLPRSVLAEEVPNVDALFPEGGDGDNE